MDDARDPLAALLDAAGDRAATGAWRARWGAGGRDPLVVAWCESGAMAAMTECLLRIDGARGPRATAARAAIERYTAALRSGTPTTGGVCDAIRRAVAPPTWAEWERASETARPPRP